MRVHTYVRVCLTSVEWPAEKWDFSYMHLCTRFFLPQVKKKKTEWHPTFSYPPPQKKEMRMIFFPKKKKRKRKCELNVVLPSALLFTISRATPFIM